MGFKKRDDDDHDNDDNDDFCFLMGKMLNLI